MFLNFAILRNVPWDPESKDPVFCLSAMANLGPIQLQTALYSPIELPMALHSPKQTATSNPCPLLISYSPYAAIQPPKAPYGPHKATYTNFGTILPRYPPTAPFNLQLHPTAPGRPTRPPMAPIGHLSLNGLLLVPYGPRRASYDLCSWLQDTLNPMALHHPLRPHKIPLRPQCI